MEGAVITESWAYVDETDQLEVTWDELHREMENATTPNDRDVHIEIDEFSWGASGPVEVIYRIAMDYGFELAVAAVAAWAKSRLGGGKGVLSDVEYATREAFRHLKRYHDSTDPEVESVEATDESVNLVIRDGHRRFKVRVRGKGALILEFEVVG